MKIYFTRHGETLWNKKGIIQGQMDSSLTKEGIDMAKNLRDMSRDIHFDKVYSSDLGRAYDTAKIIVPNREIIKTDLLREIDVGNWSGKTLSEVHEKYTDLHQKYFEKPNEYYREDGESLYDLKDRVEEFFKKVIYPDEYKEILIVTHGVTMVAMFNIMENIPIKNFWTNRVRRNGFFNIAEYKDGKFAILQKAPKNPVDSIWGDSMNYDLIIVGAGPAGLSAAIYAGRALLSTLLIEEYTFGGRINDTSEVINYPGFVESSGREIVDEFRKHAESFNTNDFTYGTVKKIEKEDGIFKITTKRRRVFYSKAVIITTGTSSKVINVPGERELTGSGVSYCATCDADYFINKDIHILGSGDLALEEADYLSNFTNSINMIIIHDVGEFDGNALEVDRIKNNPKISCTWNTKLDKILGNGKVESLVLHNIKEDEYSTVSSDGVFIFAGMTPNTDVVKDLVELDEGGFIKTDEMMRTSVEGIFAAGDVRRKPLRQIVTAASDGATATVFAERFIRNRGILWEYIQGELYFIKRTSALTE